MAELGPMKNAASRDGALRFRVPYGWRASDEADGTVAFYDPALDAGTLRVRVKTFTSDEEVGAEQAYRQLEAIPPEPGQALVALPDGRALRHHRDQAVIDGERTTIFVWLLASVDPPHRMQLAVFSFAVLASRAEASAGAVASLDREIRRARFAHEALPS